MLFFSNLGPQEEVVEKSEKSDEGSRKITRENDGYCTFIEEFLDERTSKKQKNKRSKNIEQVRNIFFLKSTHTHKKLYTMSKKRKVINSEFYRLKRFFQFLQKNKQIEVFSETFFDSDKGRVINEYLNHLSSLSTASKTQYCQILLTFFKFCSKKHTVVSESNHKRENSDRIISRLQKAIKKWNNLMNRQKDKKPKKSKSKKRKEREEEEEKEDTPTPQDDEDLQDLPDTLDFSAPLLNAPSEPAEVNFDVFFQNNESTHFNEFDFGNFFDPSEICEQPVPPAQEPPAKKRRRGSISEVHIEDPLSNHYSYSTTDFPNDVEDEAFFSERESGREIFDFMQEVPGNYSSWFAFFLDCGISYSDAVHYSSIMDEKKVHLSNWVQLSPDSLHFMDMGEKNKIMTKISSFLHSF